jgi:hypothetical protein
MRGRHERAVGKLAERPPDKLNPRFEAGDWGWSAACGGLAHTRGLKDQVQFVATLLALREGVLFNQQARAHADLDARFFDELAGQGRGCGFAELNVPARQVDVSLLCMAAQEHVMVLDDHGTGDGFDDGGVMGHAKQ